MLKHLTLGLLPVLMLAANALAQVSPFKIDPNLKLSGRLAFVAEEDKQSRIYILDLDAKQVRPFVTTNLVASYPSWSPDGTKLAFSSEVGGQREIYTANWDGSELARLTFSSKPADHPTWSPSGKSVLYYSGSNLFEASVDGGPPVKLTKFTGQNTTPAYAPDGTQISYSTNRFWPGWDICIFDLTNKKERCPMKAADSHCRAAWSPNGSSLAYSIGSGGEIDLELLKLATGERTTLTRLPGREYDAGWSPSGGELALAAEEGRTDIFNIYLLTINTKQVKRIVESPLSLRYLSWTAATTLQLESKRLATQQHEEDELKY